MATVLTLMKLMPAIMAAIMAAEATVGAGQGASKKALVLAAMQAVSQVGETLDNKTAAAISAMVDNLCTVLNATGTLKHPAA